MSNAIRSGVAIGAGPLEKQTQSEILANRFVEAVSENQVCSAVDRAVFLEAGSSGTSLKTRKPRRRPSRVVQNQRKIDDGQLLDVAVKQAPKKLFVKQTKHTLEPGDKGDQEALSAEGSTKRKSTVDLDMEGSVRCAKIAKGVGAPMKGLATHK